MFGISEKKKRGIIVPVMALAVCAVAMVGLGFALETSVTSNSNTEGILMVDLADDLNKFTTTGPNGSASSDSVLAFEIMTDKETVTGQPTVKYKINGDAYLRVFGNIADVTLTVDVDSTSFTELTTISLSLYSLSVWNASKLEGDPLGSATVQLNNSTHIGIETFSNRITSLGSSSNGYEDFVVVITGFSAGDNTIQYNMGSKVWEDTNGDKFIEYKGRSLDFTFKAAITSS